MIPTEKRTLSPPADALFLKACQKAHMTYKQHPLSASFPAMDADDFQSLKDSIENIGVQNPITLYDGMVIDGWHRYTIATELGMECRTVDLGEVDPRDFVLAQNRARRHITQAQLAMATTTVYAWRPVGNPAFSQSGTECPIAKSNAQLAEAAGVSEKTIKQAKAVQTKAAPEVIAAVKSGEIGLPKAAAIAKLPKEEQVAAIAKPMPKAAPEPSLIQAPPAALEASEDYTDLDAARDQISELQIELARLSDRLAIECYDVSEEAKTDASRIITELRAEVQSLNAQLAAVTLSRDTYMEENAQMKAQMKMQRREIENLKSKG